MDVTTPDHIVAEKAKRMSRYLDAMSNTEAKRYVGQCVCGRLVTGAMFRRNECPSCHRPLSLYSRES